MALQKYKCLDCFEELILRPDFLICSSCQSENLKKVFKFETTIKKDASVGQHVKQSIEETKEKIKEIKKDRMKINDI